MASLGLSQSLIFSVLLLVPLATANLIREKRAAVPKSESFASDVDVKQPDLSNKNKIPLAAGAALGSNFKPPGQPGKDVHFGAPAKTNIKISESLECAEDVKRFCSDKIGGSNFLVLDCLQDNERTDEKLSAACHHFLWNFKWNLTLDIRFDKASYEACSAEFTKIQDCASLKMGEGLIIPCLVEHYDEITSKPCTNFINKMAGIVFSDYRFMARFIGDCKNDIDKLRCGRMDSDSDDSPHSQGKVVACLEEHKKELEKKCKKALLHVAELQADDYHLDRPLYYACRDDREEFCKHVVAGDGAIFKCLYEHLGDKGLSEQCRARLEIRQQLINDDVKVNKVFYDACREDIKINKCGTGSEVDGEVEEDLSRTTILLCLETAQNEGAKIQASCIQEMFELRQELMEDYKISPELVSACQKEIQEHCNGLEAGGETIECLMKQSMKRKKNEKRGDSFSHECRAQIESLLNVADVGEDIRLDKPLMRGCGDVISAACSKRLTGQGDIITCLLENLDHEEMTDECEEHLLVIQYFAIRDFKLDHHLFKQCKKDAKKLCSASDFDDPKSMAPEQGPLIFSCLYRHMKSPDDTKPSRACIHEVRRVMRERGTRIELNPEVEDACILDLAEKCSDDDEHTEKLGEMECLQNNLEALSSECRDKVTIFTEEESDDIGMDHILMKACTPMIEKFCSSFLDNGAMPEEVLECLIKHKTHPDMHPKCAVGIEHHQVISLKDIRFNKKFKEHCQDAVAKYCKNKKTKYDIVACLSEHVRNDTLTDAQPRIEKKCQRQLRFELLQRSESYKLDPEMEAACGADKDKYCADKHAGEAQVIDCLKAHKKKLSDKCHRIIFKREQEEVAFGDFNLLNTCKHMLIKYDCNTEGGGIEALECLKKFKEEDDFDDRCRKMVQRRLIEQTRDFRLDPHLQKACRQDIPKFCMDVFEGANSALEMDGKVVNCLKKKYASRPKILSSDCEREIKTRIKEAALDINQNPVLMKICKEDIKRFCLNEITNVKRMEIDEGDDLETYKASAEGAIMECLKNHFTQLLNQECKKEVAYVIQESRIDVNVDPLLHSTCQQDLVSLCKTIPQGQGRLMSCLLSYLEKDPNSLTTSCRQMLKSRYDLWSYAAQVAPPESFNEIAEQVMLSPSRNYFMAIFFSALGIIFIMGLTCGRVTKRVRAELKNK